jgi:predicted dehydrogenase
MDTVKRRTFLQAATAAAASRAFGANDRINVAVIGLRGRGRDHMTIYGKQPGVRIAAVCDIDQAQVERAQQLVEQTQGSKADKTYADLRQLFADKDIDAVSIATCNHWHALATIWACQAGKDVYIEKPASHNIWEGRKMIEAARKYNRIVEVGMQSRSMDHKIKAIQMLREGVIGKVYMAKGLCYKRRKSIGKSPDGPIPPGVDYSTWLGPAPMRPFNPNRFHYNWHWFWDTGNGDIGNQGVHEMDVARWGLNQNTLPKHVVATGGKFIYDDDQETANTQLATFDYGDAQLVFEVRGIHTGGESSVGLEGGNYVGNLFFGSEGHMALDYTGYQVYLGEKRELAHQFTMPRGGEDNTVPHVRNFLSAVRSRKRETLTADIEQGHFSAALCHLANISYRTGRKLEFDPAKEQFVGDTQANSMISREYRAPFVVPRNV